MPPHLLPIGEPDTPEVSESGGIEHPMVLLQPLGRGHLSSPPWMPQIKENKIDGVQAAH